MNIKVWTQFSRAKEQFSPALTELQEIGYLSDWELCRTLDGTDFKLVFAAGPIFRNESRSDQLRQRDDKAVVDERFNRTLNALTDRGLTEKAARRLLFAVPDDIEPMEQIAWIDSIIARDPRKFENPAGMYVSFIRDGIMPPPGFVSSHRRKQLETDHLRNAEAAAGAKALEMEIRYSEYCERQVNSYISTLMPEARLKLTKDARKAATRHISHFDALTREQHDDLVSRFAFNIVVSEISLLTREEFCSREQFQQLSLDSSEGR